LRLFEESDAAELFALIEANREYLIPWLPWAADRRLESTSEFLRATRAQLADSSGLQAAIIDDEGRIIGSVGLVEIHWRDRRASIGYWLAHDRTGRGTMTEAVRAMLDHAFGTLGLNRVELHAQPENEASRYVAQRVGFREEGVQRQAQRFEDGYRDLVVHAVLAEDW
jgi:ribosomal-protein-serine acetyltransferase